MAPLFCTSGTYASAIEGDSELSRLLIEFGQKNSDDDDSDAASSEGTLAVDDLTVKLESGKLSPTLVQKASVKLMQRAEAVPVDVQKRETLRALKASTRPKEKREQGSVKKHIYANFIRANGYVGVRHYR